MYLDPLSKIWGCVGPSDPAALPCPVDYGYYQLCGEGDERAPIPDDYEENPLGECHCDGEVWISAGCSYAFICDEDMDGGGELRPCEEVINLY